MIKHFWHFNLATTACEQNGPMVRLKTKSYLAGTHDAVTLHLSIIMLSLLIHSALLTQQHSGCIAVIRTLCWCTLHSITAWQLTQLLDKRHRDQNPH